MDLTLYTIIRGLAIGILVSAPMGPIGILCIQRTLNKGRWSGFVTGLGAALSDLIYALLTGLGMSIVIDFIEANQNILQILGSLVLVGFGLYLYRQNPAKNIRKANSSINTFTQDFITAFLLTFSNPLILFLYIGLFARFNFFLPESQLGHHVVGYLSILLGAVSWWFLITYVINKVRARFNVRSIWLINRGIGIIIIIMSIVGFVWGIKDYFCIIYKHHEKVIEVPFVAGLCDKPLSQVSEILEAQGVRQAIDCVDWPNEFPYKPITSFYIARDKECLYINYFVKGNYLRAVNSTDNSPVWEDSCVEFFVQIPGEKYYYNFEFNCIGTALAARRTGREDAEHFSADKMAKSNVIRRSVINRFVRWRGFSRGIYWSPYLLNL